MGGSGGRAVCAFLGPPSCRRAPSPQPDLARPFLGVPSDASVPRTSVVLSGTVALIPSPPCALRFR